MCVIINKYIFIKGSKTYEKNEIDRDIKKYVNNNFNDIINGIIKYCSRRQPVWKFKIIRCFENKL
jgi:hypothetical protein